MLMSYEAILKQLTETRRMRRAAFVLRVQQASLPILILESWLEAAMAAALAAPSAALAVAAPALAAPSPLELGPPPAQASLSVQQPRQPFLRSRIRKLSPTFPGLAS